MLFSHIGARQNAKYEISSSEFLQQLSFTLAKPVTDFQMNPEMHFSRFDGRQYAKSQEQKKILICGLLLMVSYHTESILAKFEQNP